MNIIATATKVTVPFEAKDLISGALRSIRSALQDTTDDLLAFRRAAGQSTDDFITGSRRARQAADELGSRIQDAADEARNLGRQEVRDLFTGARQGANEFRRSVNRAEAEVHGMSDARVHLRARDEVSPVLDGISSKISGIVSAAGGIVIGGGLKDAVFGDISDYYYEASRSSAFLQDNVRQQGLSTVDKLYQQGLIPSREEGAKQLADVAPLSKDKSKAPDFLRQSAKIQYIRPDSGAEEVNRALAQSSDTFKESYAQVADSMMYAYKEVGDRQQDLFDTFWEYSGYFKNTGASSAQMSNFLVKSVQEGSFNFDKPADFFKEVFGVKALSTSDMANYFALRGAGKNEAQRQATAFTDDINSGDKQRAKGALMALVGDLASQSQNDLKQSLVTLGSATAEDNGNAVLRTFGVPFQQAPADITGTTDRLVQKQKDANPMQPMIETQREISKQMQDIGVNIASAALPAMKEFNQLLKDNKGEIQALGKGIVDGVSLVTKVYKDHFGIINVLLAGALGGLLIKKGVDTVKGIKNIYSDIKGAGVWVKNKTYGRSRKSQSVGGELAETFSGSNTMTVNASVVYLSGRIGGGNSGIDIDSSDDGKRRKSKRTGRKSARKGLSALDELKVQSPKISGPKANLPGGYRPAGKKFWDNIPMDRTYKRDDVVDMANKGKLKRYSELEQTLGSTQKKSNWFKSIIPGGGKATVGETKSLGKVAEGFLKGGSKLLKGAGIVGTVASVGMGAYDLYQTAKDKGLREAASTKGGSMVGSIGGGIIGGAIGSLAGPIGTAAGAAIGSWAGEQLGSWADSSGLTRNVVDKTVELKDSVVSWSRDTASSIKESFGSMKEWFTGKKDDPVKPPPPPEAKVSFDGMSPGNKEKVQQAFNEFSSTMAKKGIGEAFDGVVKQPAIQETMGTFKTFFKDMWKGTESTKAEQNIHSVGSASLKTASDAKTMGQTAKSSTDEIVKGAHEAGQSFNGISSSAKSAADQTRQHLMSLQTISSQGSSWGSNLISMITSGIRSKFPSLTSAVSEAAGVIKNFLGFHSPTKEGPASDSDLWAGNFVSMFSSGLKPDSVRERMNLIAGTMRRGIESMNTPLSSNLDMELPIAKSLNQTPSTSSKSITIGEIKLDFGDLAKGITDFAQFAKMLASPEGRALISRVTGEEMLKTLEIGG